MANKYLDYTGLSYFWGKLKTYLTNNYLKLSGGTMTGVLKAKANQYSDSYTSSGIDMQNSNIVGVNAIYTADTSDSQSEGVHFYRSSTAVDTLYAYYGELKFVPNRPIGGSGTAQTVLVSKSFEQGTYDRTTFPLISTVRPNRLAFLPPDQVIIEKTIDGGTTWLDAGVSDTNKTILFTGNTENALGVDIPLDNGVRTTNCGIRITFTAMKYNVPEGTPETEKYNYWNSTYVKSQERYTSLELLWFWLSSTSNKMRVYLYRATGANPNNWQTVFNTDFPLAGWSGSDWIRFSSSTFGGGTTQTGNHWNYRLVFFSRLNDGASEFTGTLGQSIYRIQGYGQNGWQIPNSMMGTDHLYSYNHNKDATFPANVTATKFIGPIQGNADTATKLASGKTIRTNLASTSTVSFDGSSNITPGVTGTLAVGNGGTGKTSGIDAANYFLNELSTGSSTPVDADYYISQYVNGGSTTKTYHRRPMSAMWEYIKGKISSVLGLTASTYGGSSATVNGHTVLSDVPANAAFTDTTNYDDLTNKPTIPSALSDLQEDSTHRLVTNDQITLWTAKSDFSGSYTDLTNKPSIPTTLSQLTEDNSHRTVSDAEKAAWNAKYNKATSGIPMSDLSDQVQTLLRSIGTDTATFTDEIIIGDVRFKRYSTKRLMITDVES